MGYIRTFANTLEYEPYDSASLTDMMNIFEKLCTSGFLIGKLTVASMKANTTYPVVFQEPYERFEGSLMPTQNSDMMYKSPNI